MQAIYEGSVENVAAKQTREQTVERAGIGSACFLDRRLYDIVALTDNGAILYICREEINISLFRAFRTWK